MLSPFQEPVKWDHTPESLSEEADAAIARFKRALDNVASLKPEECNFESVFVFIESEQSTYNASIDVLTFYQNASGSQALREASSKADSRSRDFEVERSMRMDVFNAKIAAEKNIKAEEGKWEEIGLEGRRLVEKMVLEGKRAGLGLPSEKQDELKMLKKELSQATLEFMKNFNEENGSISFTKEELKGVPEGTLSGYSKRTVTSVNESGEEIETEQYIVSFKGPDYSPVMGFAENAATRKRIHEAVSSRLAVNVPIISKIINLRRKIALLLGYKNWADYVTDDRMIKSGKAVEEFLDGLATSLLPFGQKERDTLLAIKQADYASRNLPLDDAEKDKFYVWDNGYYGRLHTEQTLKIDAQAVKEHFPVEKVVPVVLEIYQDMFRVKFVRLEGASVWHPDVQAYAVWEKDAADGETGLIGYTYLDLYPRPGKFSHIAVWPLVPGRILPSGQRQYPVNAMLANLASPNANTGAAALMRHHDVVMFFHEMGHVFHDLMSRTKYGRFHGTTCWEPKILKKISSHYQTGEPIPDELAESLAKSRLQDRGLFYLQQIFNSKYDLKVHYDCDQLGSPEAYTALWNKIYGETLPLDYDQECPGHCAFSHLASGYDVGYYGYQYSQVFAADMYATIFKSDPLDPSRAKLYREKILIPGSTRDELDILEEFLGRPPNNDAFKRQLFGSTG
ncbi:Thimet oligopeptidase [Psilocybe cubensis]|uniref:Thimet oligopeptidase n=1 Tax=Psilocybe cubensis TaxID=181762 RepID=A0ACB8H1G0_PSICU|nr:Thimet oligopeptidase [Psilocybe cubensis]KAH9481084.1 Thimet oligopeptidase [Psilocybe cubensis]